MYPYQWLSAQVALIASSAVMALRSPAVTRPSSFASGWPAARVWEAPSSAVIAERSAAVMVPLLLESPRHRRPIAVARRDSNASTAMPLWVASVTPAPATQPNLTESMFVAAPALTEPAVVVVAPLPWTL